MKKYVVDDMTKFLTGLYAVI